MQRAPWLLPGAVARVSCVESAIWHHGRSAAARRSLSNRRAGHLGPALDRRPIRPVASMPIDQKGCCFMEIISRRLLTLAVAVLALCGLGASAAWAALPEFRPAGGVFKNPVTYTAETGEIEIVASYGFPVVCQKSKGEGTITGPKALTIKFAFTGCKGAQGTWSSEGAAAGEIRTPSMVSFLAYTSKTGKAVGVVVNNPASVVFAKLLVNGGKAGEILWGPIIPVTPVNALGKSLTMKMRVDTEGIGSPREYETEAGTKKVWEPLISWLGFEEFHGGGLHGDGSLSSFKIEGKLIEIEVRA
jgi:hypothetical protein